ncbi:hypothetical protein PRUPE_5G195900 [Prunus persica]|uniref:Uncharacterized protein n=1 Tax=Prunus persica TaxID=3760 RepID=A0A251PAV0_PRUPE|nr:hypothetical protein PRUPE_5G195900 [Prunus persica]
MADLPKPSHSHLASNPFSFFFKFQTEIRKEANTSSLNHGNIAKISQLTFYLYYRFQPFQIAACMPFFFLLFLIRLHLQGNTTSILLTSLRSESWNTRKLIPCCYLPKPKPGKITVTKTK